MLEKLKTLGVNVDEAMHRLMGNTSLYERMLGKFADMIKKPISILISTPTTMPKSLRKPSRSKVQWEICPLLQSMKNSKPSARRTAGAGKRGF